MPRCNERRRRKGRRKMKRLKSKIAAGAMALMCLLACACGTQQTPAEKPTEPAEPSVDAELISLLETVETDYFPGTAGCSLTGAALAGKLLDWYAENNAEADVIRNTAQSFYDGLDETAQESFGEQLTSLSTLSYQLLDENAESLLETAGYEAAHFPWSEEAQQTLFGVLCEGCGLEMPSAPEETVSSDDDLAQLLAKVAEHYHPGTAGCSLVGAGLAGELLDWYAESNAEEDVIRVTAQTYCDGLDETERETFGEQLVNVSTISYDLVGANAESLLEAAGYEAAHFPWSAEAQQTLFGALCEGCGLEMPAAPETEVPEA